MNNVKKIIEGPDFNWKGNIITSDLTKKTLSLVDVMTLQEGFSLVQEKILGANNLRAICILEKGIQIAKSVAHITVPGKGVATGFMISSNILITNHHVFETSADARDAIARFNYQIDLSGNFLPVDEYGFDVSFFHTSKELDYSIVRVKNEPGVKWGYMQLSTDEVINIQDDVFIIQHPHGEHKQIALSDNVIAYSDDMVIQYLTDTLPGSSGSPVLNDSMRVIALHHSGGWLPEPSTGSTHFRNEGIKISAILKHIRDSNIQLS